TFNRSGYELWIKHHVQCINPEVPFWLLVTPIHFDGITHGLKGVERKSNRQQDMIGIINHPGQYRLGNYPFQVRDHRPETNSLQNVVDGILEKIVVFKKTENSDIRDQTDDQQ